MPVTLQPTSLKYKNSNNEFQSATAIKGDTGVGVPTGGTTGQVLSKASGTDYDTEWTDPSGGTVTDVQVNGTSVVTDGVANMPFASQTVAGVVRFATAAEIKAGNGTGRSISPARQEASTFYGLAKAAGDTTQSASRNAVGTYTDNAKASIKSMLGIVDGSTGIVNVSGTTPTITAVENTRYVCGEVTSLNFTPAVSGICIVRFTSGSTVTVLTLPSTVKFPEWFDPTSLETNTIYEICVTDGTYGAVMSWAQ